MIYYFYYSFITGGYIILNIAIIDDISTDAEDLKNIAVFYFEKKQIQAEIYQFFSAEEFFEDYQPENFRFCSWIFI